MTDEEAFHAALDAHPDDWLTRLVLADYLEERGDPRAEGVKCVNRLQFQALGRYNDSGPDGCANTRRPLPRASPLPRGHVMATAKSTAFCLHCNARAVAPKKRGLCLACYNNITVRHAYPKHKPGKAAGDAGERFWSKIEKAARSDCWHWVGRLNVETGYGCFDIRVGGNWGAVCAHRYAYELLCSPIGDMHVLHTCDNRRCVKPTHLFLGTNLDNVRDKQAKGRQLRGEQVSTARLTPNIVRTIRGRVARGESRRSVARSLDVSDRHVRDIVARKRWRHIADEGGAA